MIGKYFSKSKIAEFCKLADIKNTMPSIKEYLDKYKYAPRYLRGLSENEKYLKKFEIRYNTLLERAGKTPKNVYSRSKSDVRVRPSPKTTKYSKYTEKWNKKYPQAKSLEKKSKVSGVPLSILRKVSAKGAAAWRGSAHRPGAGQQEWSVSRVNSFLLCGKTWAFPDHKLAIEAMKKSPKAKTFWRSCDKKRLGKRTPSR
jgi:exonuclease V gamma subunit